MQSCRITIMNDREVVVVNERMQIRNMGKLEKIPVSALELDAKLSLLAETIIGPFLLPYSIECNDENLMKHLKEIIDDYRRRVVLEQAYDLYARLGPLLDIVYIAPAYFPVSRLSLIWRSVGCKVIKYFNSNIIKTLNEEYRSYLKEMFDFAKDDMVKLKPLRVREMFTSFMTSFKLSLQAGIHKVVYSLSKRTCDVPEIVEHPWNLINSEEGKISFSCPSPRELVKGECRSPTPLSESLICESNGNKVAVKDYYRLTTIKWIPATMASQLFGVKYRLGAKSRMAAEVKYLPALRDVINTPKIFRICSDYGQAYIVREYVDGTSLIKVKNEEIWENVGEKLAEIHNKGYVLGDTNPGNFVIDQEKQVWVIDAEQARRSLKSPRLLEAWDILVFLVYSLFLGIRKELLEKFIVRYSEVKGKDWESIKKISLRPQVWISLGAVAPNLLVAQKIIKEA